MMSPMSHNHGVEPSKDSALDRDLRSELWALGITLCCFVFLGC